MTRAFVTKHIRVQQNGTYKYRRRVPKDLQKILGKTEFVRVLGNSQAEAMRNYGSYHGHVEKLLKLTTPESEVDILIQTKSDLERLFMEMGLDAFSSGQSDQERLSRSEEAQRMLNNYVIDADTGQPDPKDVTLQDNAHVTALMCGIPSVEIPLTITSAFDFYLSERGEPDPYKRKKQVQRFKRATQSLLAVTKQDILVEQVNRAHARNLRDNLLQRRTPATTKRYVTDVKSVFSLAIKEHDLNINNPFSRLEYPRAETKAVDLRSPLPKGVVTSMYEHLTDKPVLLDIWTLMHHTGAQNAEILGLDAQKRTDPEAKQASEMANYVRANKHDGLHEFASGCLFLCCG